VLQLLAVVRSTIAAAQQRPEGEIALEDIEQVCAEPRKISLGHAGTHPEQHHVATAVR